MHNSFSFFNAYQATAMQERASQAHFVFGLKVAIHAAILYVANHGYADVLM
jgi:hypothetical protein